MSEDEYQAGPVQPRHGKPADGSGPEDGGKTVAALVCGILAIVFSPTIIVGAALGIVALVLGIRARKTAPDAKATAGIVCGIIGLVFSVLLLLAVYAFVHVAFDSTGYGALDSYVSEIQGATGSESDEDAARQATDDALQSAVNPSDEKKAQVADEIDSKFAQAAGMQLSDVGVDKNAVVSWMTDAASYRIDDVVVTGDTATAKVVLTVRDFDAFEDQVSQQVSNYLELNRANGATSADQIAQQVAGYVQSAMDSTGTVDDTEYVILNKNGNAWTVDQTSIDGVTSDIFDD